MKTLATNLKKLLALALIFLFFFFVSSYAARSPERSFPGKINLVNPSEFDLWGVTQGGYLEKSHVLDLSLPSKAKEAVDASPDWLKLGLHSQFRAMDYDLIQKGHNISFSAGDLNGDGVDDLLVSDGEGTLLYYKMTKIPGKSHLKLKLSFPLPISTKSATYITLLDIDQNGLSDLFLSLDGKIFFSKNISKSDQLQFEAPTEVYFEPGTTYSWKMDAFHWDKQACLILGNKDGSLSMLCFEEGKWKKRENYFPREEVFVSSQASPVIRQLPDKNLLLIVSGWEGEFAIYIITGDSKKIQSNTLIAKVPITYANAMTYIDLNQDGLTDFLYLCPPDPVMYFLNKGNSEQDSWMIFSPPYGEGLNKELEGVGYHRAGSILYATGHHTQEIEECAKFILDLEKPYLDEVVYCISSFQTSDLLAFIEFKQLEVLVENVKNIYAMCERVSYVKISEQDDWTTLNYSSDEGWKEMPKRIYYHNLVMPSRSLVQPEVTFRMYAGHFYRSYLPDNKTYGVSLFERVSGAKTLYEAAYLTLQWLKQDIGGVWRPGNKPAGWYHVYKNLQNPEAGIWCAEWATIYQAAARAMNIPVIIVTALGEDHQFNNFWADEWHHVDASSGESTDLSVWKEYFDDSLVYSRLWKDRTLSWPMVTDSESIFGRSRQAPLKYSSLEKLSDLSFKIFDLNGDPLDGVQIILASHWPMEERNWDIPNLTAVTYTDSRGVGIIKNVAPQNYTLHVISKIGSLSRFLPLKNESPPESISLTIPAVQPSLFEGRDQSVSFVDQELPRIEKRVKVIKIGQTDYIEGEIFAQFVNANLSTHVQRHLVVFSKEFFYIEAYLGKDSIRLSNGKKIVFESPPVLDHHNKVLISLDCISYLFDVESEYTQESESVLLSYRPVTSLQVELNMKWFFQKNIPWNDSNYVLMKHFEHWTQRFGKLKLFVTDQANMDTLLKGKNPAQGEWYELNEDSKIIIEVPDHLKAPLKILVHNPQFRTSVFYDLNFSLIFPGESTHENS